MRLPQRRTPAVLAAILLAALAAHRTAVAAPPIEVGQPFPDLVLPALDDGRPLSIADFRGKKVLLLVFASW